MKRTKLRKKSKDSIRQIQDKIWVEAKRIVDEQFGIDCYTCGKKNLKGRDKQLGHMIPKASLGAFLKYDIRLLRNQCFSCNIWKGGNGAEFYRKMLLEQGTVYMDELLRDRQKSVKASDFYPKLLVVYKNIIR